jgi:hypothetical protein
MGKQRANRLPALFDKSVARPDPLPTPDFLFATHNSDASHRPLETVTPLAAKLKLPINRDYRNTLDSVTKKGKEAKGINDLHDELFAKEKYAGKTVLISWHHGTIPDLAKALKATQAPAKWNGAVFDRVWHLSYDDKGKVTFTDRPQRLLPDDTKK